MTKHLSLCDITMLHCAHNSRFIVFSLATPLIITLCVVGLMKIVEVKPLVLISAVVELFAAVTVALTSKNDPPHNITL